MFEYSAERCVFYIFYIILSEQTTFGGTVGIIKLLGYD